MSGFEKLWVKSYIRAFVFLLACVLLACAVVFFVPSIANSTARLLWNGFHQPQAALFIDKTDAYLALTIGNYYFGSPRSSDGSSGYDPTLALAAYQEALHINPQTSSANYQIGRILFIRGDYNEAISALNSELSIAPNNFRAYYVRGLVNAYAGNYASADNDFAVFISHALTEWAGYNDRAWALSLAGRYQDALAVMQVAFKQVPNAADNPWLWNTLGTAQLDLYDYADAFSSFTTAQKLASSLTEADWLGAYPGNDPTSAPAGIARFQKAITTNLQTAALFTGSGKK